MKKKNVLLPVRMLSFACVLAMALGALGLAALPAWAETYKDEVLADALKKDDVLAEGAKVKTNTTDAKVTFVAKNYKRADDKKVGDTDLTVEGNTADTVFVTVGSKGAITATHPNITPYDGKSDGSAWKVSEVTTDAAGLPVVKLVCDDVKYSVKTASGITGGTVQVDPTSAIEGTTVTVTATASAGYEFGSYTVTDAAKNTISVSSPSGSDNKATFTMPKNTVTVAATFKQLYTVTVEADPASGGSVSCDPESASEGTEVSLTATPAKGYVFSGWSRKSGSSNVTVSDNKFTMPSGAVSLVAKFVQRGDVSYQLTKDDSPKMTFPNFDEDFAEAILTDDDNAELDKGNNIVVTLNATEVDSVESKVKKDLTAAADGKSATIGAYIDITLSKKTDGKSKETISEIGTDLKFTVQVPKDMQEKNRTYYLIRYHNGKCEVLAESTETTLSAKTKLFSTYAIAYKEPTKKVTVSYDANGGKGSMKAQSTTVNANTYEIIDGTLTLRANKFTRSGYIFTSWNTKADGSGSRVKDKASLTKLSANVTLYAQWVKRSTTSKTGSTGVRRTTLARTSSASTASIARRSKSGTPKTGDLSFVGLMPVALAGAAAVGRGLYRRRK